MRADTTAAYHYHESIAELLEAFVCQKDTVAGELFKDQIFIVVS